MTYTAPTVTKLQSICEASELPTMPELSTVGIPDSRRNSRPLAHLKTSHWALTELKYARCQNFRRLPGLPTVGTPDSRRNSRPSAYLKTIATELEYLRCRNSRYMSELPTLSTFKNCCCPLVIHTGHVRYDHHSELSKLFKLRVVGTPDHCRNFRPSELPTVGTPDEPTREQHFYSYWANTGHVRYGQTSNKSVSSFVSQTLKSHMGWLEHLWNIIYQHDASLLIVRHSYLLKFKSITNLNLLSCSFWTEAVYSNLHQVRAPTCWYWSFSLEHSHLEHVTWFHSSNLNNPKCIKSLLSNTPIVIWSFTSIWPS